MAGSRLIQTDLPPLTSPTEQQVVDWIRSCSAPQLRSLLDGLEERLGVSVRERALLPLRPFVTSNPPWIFEADNPPSPSCALVLDDPGPRRAELIVMLRRHPDFAGLSLREVRDRVEAVPVHLLEHRSRDGLEPLRLALVALGAAVRVRER